jgi:hypothetical protein
MSDFGEEYTHVPLQCDSTSAISVAKNPVLHSKTKHIEVRYHFLRGNVEKGKIALIHVPTHDQLAYIFTKPLDQASFTRLWGELGVCLVSWVGEGPDWRPERGGEWMGADKNSSQEHDLYPKITSEESRTHLPRSRSPTDLLTLGTS